MAGEPGALVPSRGTADRTLFGVAMVIVLIVCAWTKWMVLPTMATHVDDLIVATTILDARNELAVVEIRPPGDTGPVSALERDLRRAKRLGVPAAAAEFLVTAVSVPVHSTYAPAQFLLTTALVRDAVGYRRTLQVGRLPSFLSGVLASVLAALAAFRLGGPQARARAIVAAALVGCSWELLIFSAQMESYAIGVAGAALLALMLVRVSAAPTRRELLLEGMCVALVPWLQYQLVFLLPAYLIVRVWQLSRGWSSLTAVARSSAIALLPVVASAAIVYRFFLSHYSGAGVSWNAGPAGEFLFLLPAGASFGAAFDYAMRFFSTNTVLTLASMVSFLPEQNPGYWAAALLTLFLGGAGTVALVREPDIRSRSLAAFVGVTAVIWILMVVAGKITLSPTRHSLVLLPLIALLAAEGACAVGARLRRPVTVPLAYVGFVVLTFVLNYPAEARLRSDPFDEPSMRALVVESDADLIVSYHCTRNLRIMIDLGAPLFDWGCGSSPRWIGPMLLEPPRRILFVSARDPLSAEAFSHARIVLDSVMRRPLLEDNLERYRVTVLRKVEGSRPLEVSSRTINGTNSLYVTLLEPREGSRAPLQAPRGAHGNQR